MPASLLFINPKFSVNIGTMARNAELLGFEKLYISQYGRTGKRVGATDTAKSFLRIGEFIEDDIQLIKQYQNNGDAVLAVELDDKAQDVSTFDHPKDALYIIGSEDKGISEEVLNMVDKTLVVPAEKPWSYNAADAAAIVMYDRYVKNKK